jgi:hypothetical protein
VIAFTGEKYDTEAPLPLATFFAPQQNSKVSVNES